MYCITIINHDTGEFVEVDTATLVLAYDDYRDGNDPPTVRVMNGGNPGEFPLFYSAIMEDARGMGMFMEAMGLQMVSVDE